MSPRSSATHLPARPSKCSACRTTWLHSNQPPSKRRRSKTRSSKPPSNWLRMPTSEIFLRQAPPKPSKKCRPTIRSHSSRRLSTEAAPYAERAVAAERPTTWPTTPWLQPAPLSPARWKQRPPPVRSIAMDVRWPLRQRPRPARSPPNGATEELASAPNEFANTAANHAANAPAEPRPFEAQAPTAFGGFDDGGADQSTEPASEGTGRPGDPRLSGAKRPC